MEEDRMPKKIFTQELEGTRRRGRPKKRWKEEAERDLQVLRVRELVADRKKWKDIVRQTKAHSGFLVPMEEEEEEQQQQQQQEKGENIKFSTLPGSSVFTLYWQSSKWNTPLIVRISLSSFRTRLAV